MLFQPKLTNLRGLNPIGSLYAWRRSHNYRMRVYRGVHLHVSARAQLTVLGTLRLGYQWPHVPYYRGHLHLGDDSTFEVSGPFDIYSGSQISVADGARLQLGSGFLNNGVQIGCFREIKIGHDVIIAPNVVIRDSDNHLIEGYESASARIEIGDHVWVGIGATILKGVTIGKGSIIAAGAVVTHDVPPASLVAGVPAAVKRENVSWT